MTKGIKLVILFLLGIVMIGFFVYFFFFGRRGEQIPQTSLEQVNQGQLPAIPSERLVRGGNTLSEKKGIEADNTQNTPLGSSQTQNTLSTELSQFVFLFIERFGSFSEESNFQNWKDLEVLMTSSMKDWVEKQISKNIGDNRETTTQNRITTKALSVKTQTLDEAKGNALFLIVTQRQEIFSGKESVYYQDIEIRLLRNGKDWKVDGAFWK